MKKALLALLPCLLAFSAAFSACIREPEIVIETQVDTLWVVKWDTLLRTDTLVLTQWQQDTATTFILLRHAETTGIGSNPDLSVAGLARAEDLRRILTKVPLEAIFSSNYNRTQQTAAPTATEQSLPVQTYNPSNQSPLIPDWLTNYRGKTVLVVGHSNTIPALLNLFLDSNTYTNLPDTEYDNLFIVSVAEIGRAQVLHLKY